MNAPDGNKSIWSCFIKSMKIVSHVYEAIHSKWIRECELYIALYWNTTVVPVH